MYNNLFALCTNVPAAMSAFSLTPLSKLDVIHMTYSSIRDVMKQHKILTVSVCLGVEKHGKNHSFQSVVLMPCAC
jgi:hypothetical protein